MNRIDREKRTIERMITLYCRLKEGNDRLCPDCIELLEYSRNRLSMCPFGENKGACKDCVIHCYKSDMRERMKAVMRYAGPRMIWHYPLDALLHIFS